MVGDKKEISIADLGSGPFSKVGTLYGVKINLFPSDFLALEYNSMMEKAGIIPFIKIEMQNMEELTYSDNYFDIVHCINSLDHVENVERALLEMYRVCKPGGMIYLRHYLNQGESHRYTGFHYWNFNIFGINNCKIWNEEISFRLSDVICGFHTDIVTEKAVSPRPMIVSKLYKWPGLERGSVNSDTIKE